MSKGGVSIHGPPRSQRWASDDIRRLLRFYFPEFGGMRWPPHANWYGNADPRCAAPEQSNAVNKNGEENVDASTENKKEIFSRAQFGLPDLSSWEKALHKQWAEDDDL